jgi:hypothetical protein
MSALLLAGAAFTAQAATTFTPGVLQEEYWNGVVKGAIESNLVASADLVTNLTLFDIPADIADNYAVRITGYFVAPATADYAFNCSADDTADLFLSTDETPANKRMIAQQPGWNATHAWRMDNGDGSVLPTPGANFQQRISTSWATNGVTPFASGIHLVAGTRYYIEGVMNEFGGGDNFAVSYRYPATAALDTATVEWPQDGDPPNIDSTVIAISVTSPTTFAVTTQPQNATVFAGRTATFSVVVSSDAKINGNPMPLLYQWRKGGVNILNGTSSTLAYVASQSDNGATFDCMVSYPPSSGLANTVTSSTATLTVQAGTVVSGKLKQEMWLGTTRAAVETGIGGIPSTVSEFTSFHSPVNITTPAGADFSFVRRVSGYFTPSASGNYVFFVCSDDDSDLFLSTDDSPANKKLIAQETNWSGDLAWDGTPGNPSVVTQKRSDQWSPDGGTTTPYSAGIPLVGGTRYYIEGVHHEGAGGDNFSATFTLLADAGALVDLTPTVLTNGVISYVTSPVTSGTIASQPTNVTVFETQPFSVSVGVQTDSELTPLYQWRKGGVNLTNGFATVATYSSLSSLVSESGQYDCVVTIPNSSIVLTSAVATVTVNATPFATGFLKYEFFPLKDRPTVEGGTAGNPSTGDGVHNVVGSDASGAVRSFESGINLVNASGQDFVYANRFSGFFIPPSTGDYVFFVAADDDTDVYLSTDDTPANKQLIAQETGWSGSRNWITVGGGTATQKESDTFVDGQGNTPYAAGIHLVSGNHYYLEGVHHEGGGGDNFALLYSLIGDVIPGVTPANGDAPNVAGNVIGVKVPPQPVTITLQPQNQSANQSTTATFTVAATSVGFYPPTYQWQRGGVDIVGANNASYTTGLLTPADNNAQFVCVVSILGTTPINSQTATLTVINDTTPPVIVGAGTVSFDHVCVKFDGLLDTVTASDPTKYTVSGATVTSAVTNFDGVSVTLGVSGLANGPFSVTVNGVKDLAGNAISSTTVSGHIESGLINQDVDTAGASAEPGYATSPAAGELYISGGGSDMWGNADQFHFVGAQVSGDFDKQVRVENIEPVNRWTKAGLCVRENLDNTAVGGAGIGGAINLDIYVMPLAVPTEDADPADPVGQNGIEAGFRGTSDGATGGWPTTTAGSQINPSHLPTAWIRLKGVGHTNYTAYWSTNGVDWISHSSATMNPPLVNQYVGIMLTAHDNNPGFLADVHFLNFGDFVSAPRFNPIALSSGSATISWTGSGTLQQTDTLSPPNWQTAPSQANPQTVSATTGMRFYRITSP